MAIGAYRRGLETEHERCQYRREIQPIFKTPVAEDRGQLNDFQFTILKVIGKLIGRPGQQLKSPLNLFNNWGAPHSWIKYLWTEARIETNFWRDLALLNFAIARSRRWNGWCEFSARLFSQRPGARRFR